MYRELFYENGTTIPEAAKIIHPKKKEGEDEKEKPSLGKDDDVKQALMSLAESEKE